jgi:hypothetical protein
MKIAGISDVMPCTLKTEAASFSETLVLIYQTIRCHIPEDRNLHYNFPKIANNLISLNSMMKAEVSFKSGQLFH